MYVKCLANGLTWWVCFQRCNSISLRWKLICFVKFWCTVSTYLILYNCFMLQASYTMRSCKTLEIKTNKASKTQILFFIVNFIKVFHIHPSTFHAQRQGFTVYTAYTSLHVQTRTELHTLFLLQTKKSPTVCAYMSILKPPFPTEAKHVDMRFPKWWSQLPAVQL